MPPSSKRSQRTRRVRDPTPTSPTPAEQSSPSRPSKRRRKVEEPSSEPLEDEGSSLTIEAPAPLDNDRLITQVTQHLRGLPIHAAKEHSNAIHESTEDIEAYAKISAQDWTYYIRTLSINIGRSSDTSLDPSHKDFVHIDLGPAKTFSRQTAVIYFDSEAGKWYIKVKGRNPIRIDNELLKKTESGHALASGEVIEIGGIEMMFVLPGNISTLRINPIYLERAGLKDSSTETKGALLPPASIDDASSHATAGLPSSRGQPFQQPIAPAPPDYKRPGTPPSAKSRPATSQAKTPAHGSSGTMVMNQNDVDLSNDDSWNLKPHFSYAQLITQAIMSTSDEKLNLAGIYSYIMNNYAYYRHQQPGGWQNSIRHNLSLNKSFVKAPRSTDEPGKGMKWEIVPEARDDMIKNAYKGGRGGHRGSSAPSSPSQPSQLSYITSGPKDMAGREPGSARKRKAVSPATSPVPRSSLHQVTPDRKLSAGPASFDDGSPLPPSRKALEASGAFGASDNVPRSPPTLSSSYLQEEGASFVTPAPLRVHPRLAPPSTAQRPSQHMPTSSPAPFWKYADINSTPLKAAQFDMSPLKSLGLPNSSSPPPVADDRSPVASPTRSGRAETLERSTVVEDDEEEGGFDLTKGFQSIGSYHAPSKIGALGQKVNGGRH
ncbi:fork head domain-containing protein [Biscogniauxia mediterranea]|nr:fork head domain-containing protein [Biscogniauxia mediterranea]